MTPEQHSAVMLALGRIEEKIDSHLSSDDTVHERLERSLNSAHRRVDDLDRFRHRVKGGAVVVGLLATAVTTVVMALPKYFGG